EADAEVGQRELGRAAADVEEERARLEGAADGHASHGHGRLLVAGEELGVEAVAPLDLTEERLAVLGVADGARRDEERPLGAERLGTAAKVDEGVADACDRHRQEAPPPVDALAEASDDRLAVELIDPPVLDVGDEETRRV